MEMTVEQEFMLRATNHKLVMLGFKISEDFMKSQTEGNTTIPEFMAREQALRMSKNEVARILLEGKLNEEYEKAWEEIKEVIPDDFKIIKTR